MEWVVGQIDLAQDPDRVLADFKEGKGTAAQRIFDRSFNLPQVGEDGRAALLALSLFAPDASREALAEVAGFGRDFGRLNEAVKHLAALRFVSSALAGKRLMIEGLTREMATAHLAESGRQDEFRKRFIDFFKVFAGQHAKTEAEDLDSLESEKENLSRAMAAASDLGRWNDVLSIRASLEEYLDLRGYWEQAIRTGGVALQAARNVKSPLALAQFAHNLGVTYQHRGELARAKQLYQESLETKKKLGDQSGIASSLHQLAILAQDQGNPEEARRLYQESLEIKKKLGDQSGIAISLHQLAILAQDQGNPQEARRLYQESLEIEKKLGNQSGIALSLGQLGRLAEEQRETSKAAGYYREALRIFEALHSPYTEVARRALARVEGTNSKGP
jgi:tetratricopeptide (TPR) repeat protein